MNGGPDELVHRTEWDATLFMWGGAVLLAALLALLALTLTRRFGWVSAWALCGLVWWLGVIALVTLLPLGSVDWAAAQGVARTCSFDYGGPAPDGFWIFSGTQRMLNTALFVPAGALWVLTVARWRAGWYLVPVGLVGLVACSVGLEWTQLELSRIGRACDVTDVVDNGTGAAIGIAAGLVLAVVLRPWQRRGKWARAAQREGSGERESRDSAVRG